MRNRTDIAYPLDTKDRAERLQSLLREVLVLLGEDPDREGLRGTPERWANALLTYTKGAAVDPQEHLKVIFQLDEDDYPLGSDDMIIMDNIRVHLHMRAPYGTVSRPCPHRLHPQSGEPRDHGPVQALPCGGRVR